MRRLSGHMSIQSEGDLTGAPKRSKSATYPGSGSEPSLRISTRCSPGPPQWWLTLGTPRTAAATGPAKLTVLCTTRSGRQAREKSTRSSTIAPAMANCSPARRSSSCSRSSPSRLGLLVQPVGQPLSSCQFASRGPADMRARSTSVPTFTAGRPDPVIVDSRAGVLATTTSCPAARKAQASGTIV